ncbi:MAG: hypothetical protein KKF56_05540 [Nanoarchaeota archaeon]|nr:hypothetical protein [Nanoarchaeota archaeon]
MVDKTKKELEEAKVEKLKIHQRALRKAKKVNTEFRKGMLTAVVAAFGFLIALVWKDVIVTFVDKIVGEGIFSGLLIKAVIVTLIAVVGIMIANWAFKQKEEKEEKEIVKVEKKVEKVEEKK